MEELKTASFNKFTVKIYKILKQSEKSKTEIILLYEPFIPKSWILTNIWSRKIYTKAPLTIIHRKSFLFAF